MTGLQRPASIPRFMRLCWSAFSPAAPFRGRRSKRRRLEGRRAGLSMLRLRQAVKGPWRAVPVLGVTQILAWGAIFYPVVLTTPLMAADHGWSATFTLGGFSAGLFVAGL